MGARQAAPVVVHGTALTGSRAGGLAGSRTRDPYTIGRERSSQRVYAQATVGDLPRVVGPVGATRASPSRAAWRGNMVGFPTLAGRTDQA